MTDKEKILASVFKAIDDTNDLKPAEKAIVKSPDTALFGPGSTLDSLGLVGLIVAIEENVRADFGVTVTLVDETVFSQTKSPFLTIASLVKYIDKLLVESEKD